MVFHWQLHVWISCHISLERPWMGPLIPLLLDGQACAFRGQLSHRDSIARPPPVDELHSVIRGWFTLGSGTWWAVSAQPQAPRATFQAWTPNNHALFMEARGKTRVGHSRHEWERTGKRKEWFLWVIARVFREVKAWFWGADRGSQEHDTPTARRLWLFRLALAGLSLCLLRGFSYLPQPVWPLFFSPSNRAFSSDQGLCKCYSLLLEKFAH